MLDRMEFTRKISENDTKINPRLIGCLMYAKKSRLLNLFRLAVPLRFTHLLFIEISPKNIKLIAIRAIIDAVIS